MCDRYLFTINFARFSKNNPLSYAALASAFINFSSVCKILNRLAMNQMA